VNHASHQRRLDLIIGYCLCLTIYLNQTMTPFDITMYNV